MNAQELIILSYLLRMLIAANKHGQIRERSSFNFWWTVFFMAVNALILWWGGFWNNIHWSA